MAGADIAQREHQFVAVAGALKLACTAQGLLVVAAFPRVLAAHALAAVLAEAFDLRHVAGGAVVAKLGEVAGTELVGGAVLVVARGARIDHQELGARLRLARHFGPIVASEDAAIGAEVAGDAADAFVEVGAAGQGSLAKPGHGERPRQVAVHALFLAEVVAELPYFGVGVGDLVVGAIPLVEDGGVAFLALLGRFPANALLRAGFVFVFAV